MFEISFQCYFSLTVFFPLMHIFFYSGSSGVVLSSSLRCSRHIGHMLVKLNTGDLFVYLVPFVIPQLKAVTFNVF